MVGMRCLEPDAPSVFPDDWGIGRHGRAARCRALSLCRSCPCRRECALQTLREADMGLEIYGVRAGVVFTDVILARQQEPLERLRRQVA